MPGAPHALNILADAARIYVSGCAAEIASAPALLAACRRPDVMVTGVFSPLINHRSYVGAAQGLRVRSFFLTRALKRDFAMGGVEYCPWRYNEVDRWLAEPGRFDTALVMVSPPDADGMCSTGVQADFLPSFIDRVGRVIGVVNPHMPRTAGDTRIRRDSFAAVIEEDVPLPEMVARAPDPVSVAIARRIVDLVRDGATVQFGVGQIPSQVLGRLGDHRGLRVHSGVIDDNILTLEASGALDRDVPVVTGTAVGSARLYAAVGEARRFAFRAVRHTHAAACIAAQPHFTAINSVLRVDLLGQVSAEGSGGRLIASPGGLPEFVRGALAHPDGTSIIAVRAGRSETQPGGIVPVIADPALVTNPAGDADIVVTEHGVARLRGLSIDARAEAMIAIAAPEDRADLERAWSAVRAGWLA